MSDYGDYRDVDALRAELAASRRWSKLWKRSAIVGHRASRAIGPQGDEIARLDAELAAVKSERDALAAALERRPCPDCGGRGSYAHEHRDTDGEYLGREEVQCECLASSAILAALKQRMKDEGAAEKAEQERAALAAALEKCGEALEMLYEQYETGESCTEDGEIDGAFIGRAVNLSGDEESQCLEALESVGIQTILRSKTPAAQFSPSTILSARDQRKEAEGAAEAAPAQRAAGAVWALRDRAQAFLAAPTHNGPIIAAHLVLQADAIERGDVEVPDGK